MAAYRSMSLSQQAGCRQRDNTKRARFRYLCCLAVQAARSLQGASELFSRAGKAAGEAVGVSCESKNKPNSTSDNWRAVSDAGRAVV